MKYEMNVVIYNPETKAEKEYKLSCAFIYDETDYGNKHYLSIWDNESFDKYIDIRYDKDFKTDNKIEYLSKWASNYWTGKNGAYAIKSLEIKKAG